LFDACKKTHAVRDDETTVLNRIDTNVALVQAMWPCRQN
jgi:hypothetical protein